MELKIEDRIKEYFKIEKQIKDLNKRLIATRDKIEEYKELLKNVNMEFYIDLGCQQYSDEIKAKGGKPSSKVEQEIERRYRQVENYLAHYIREECYIEDKIHNLQIDIEHMDMAFEELNSVEKEVVIERFKNKNSMKKISWKLFGGAERTAYRVYNKAIEKIENGRVLAESWQTFGREMAESWQNS